MQLEALAEGGPYSTADVTWADLIVRSRALNVGDDERPAAGVDDDDASPPLLARARAIVRRALLWLLLRTGVLGGS